MLLAINPDHPEPRKIRRAVEAVDNGEVIAYPTDSCYAFGCDLFNKRAVDQLYVIKGLERKQQFSFICPDLSDIARYAMVDTHAYRLLKRLVPGPYTFILQATREVPKIVQSKRATVGIRVPHHPVTHALLAELGRPMISTTAAPHGDEPLIDPTDIDRRFRGVSLVLDGGVGGMYPTTIIDLSGPEPKVVRKGAGPTDLFE